MALLVLLRRGTRAAVGGDAPGVGLRRTVGGVGRPRPAPRTTGRRPFGGPRRRLSGVDEWRPVGWIRRSRDDDLGRVRREVAGRGSGCGFPLLQPCRRPPD